MDRLRKQIASCLAVARAERGLSQSELAKLVNVQPSAISHFELGRRMPNCNNLLKLADALGVSIDTLFGRDIRIPIRTPRARKQTGANVSRRKQTGGK